MILPPREARRAPVPSTLHPSVVVALQARFPNGLHAHQSAAIEAVGKGDDVYLATATASGKSLVFMASAADLALRSPGATVGRAGLPVLLAV